MNMFKEWRTVLLLGFFVLAAVVGVWIDLIEVRSVSQ